MAKGCIINVENLSADSFYEGDSEMADCEFLETCSIFDRFKLEGIKNFWIKLYY